jgi:hypothetical protein
MMKKDRPQGGPFLFARNPPTTRSPKMPSLALCNYTLDAGRRCGQPRLRGETVCRFHIRNRAVAEHEERMYRLWDELVAMDFPEVLETLNQKLDRIQCILRPYPEARLTLLHTLDRLSGRIPMEPMTSVPSLKLTS